MFVQFVNAHLQDIDYQIEVYWAYGKVYSLVPIADEGYHVHILSLWLPTRIHYSFKFDLHTFTLVICFDDKLS